MSSFTKRILARVAVIILICIALVILFLIGIYIGYVVIGHGKSVNAFNTQTWQHIFDFMK